MMYLTSVVGALVAVMAAQAGDVELPWWGQALIAVAGAVTTFLLGLLARALNKLFDYLAQKSRIAKLAEIDELIMGFVSEVAQQKVGQLKAAAADGKLSQAEIDELKKIPLDRLKEIKGVKFLTGLLGDQLESYVASRVERAVVAQKAPPANP